MTENTHTEYTCIFKKNIDKNNNNISQLSKPTLDRQQPKSLHFKPSNLCKKCPKNWRPLQKCY